MQHKIEIVGEGLLAEKLSEREATERLGYLLEEVLVHEELPCAVLERSCLVEGALRVLASFRDSSFLTVGLSLHSFRCWL